jgi:iron(III) transport system permease protein
VVLPLLAPTLVLWWSLLFILAWGELDASVLVAPPGWTPVSVRLFSLMHYGPSSMVAALSLVSTLFALGGAGGGFLAYRLLRRQVYG